MNGINQDEHLELNSEFQLLAIGCSLVLAVLGCVPLYLVPVQNRMDEHRALLRGLLCLAFGSVVANAFVHILPEVSSTVIHSFLITFLF